MSNVQRYRRKPDREDRDDQQAARYEPGQPLDDLARVAHMADTHRCDAEFAEVTLPSGPVLLVRWQQIPDDHPARIEYEVVEPGKWLAYSPGNDHLYTTDDANWRQFYDLVTEEERQADG